MRQKNIRIRKMQAQLYYAFVANTLAVCIESLFHLDDIVTADCLTKEWKENPCYSVVVFFSFSFFTSPSTPTITLPYSYLYNNVRGKTLLAPWPNGKRKTTDKWEKKIHYPAPISPSSHHTYYKKPMSNQFCSSKVWLSYKWLPDQVIVKVKNPSFIRHSYEIKNKITNSRYVQGA